MSDSSTGMASFTLFENTAEDLAERIASDPSDVAISMRQEALVLVAEFRGWVDARPADEARIATIEKLFDLQRRILDHLLRGRPSH